MKLLKQMVMKKILTILAFFFLSYGFSQTGINYQAIIKNSSGNVYSNATMVVTFSLRYDTSGGSVIYSETHSATSTSEGQISLVVGTGNKTSNGVDFSAIDFSKSIFYTTEVNIGGAGNVSLGTQQLRSVSSAYFAKTAASISTDANDNVVIGSTSSMVSMTSGIAIGSNAVTNNTTGIALTAVGISALRGNTTGNNNTAIGNFALSANTTGDNNTAIGYQTGTGNTTGVLNTAIGSRAMRVNVTGSSNTALGNEALTLNTTGSENTALGVSALTANSTGTQNVAVGKDALYNNTASNQTAVGYKALYNSSYSSLEGNVAVGHKALFSSLGSGSVAIGNSAGQNNTYGFANTALGFKALENNTTGSYNIAIGHSAGASITLGTNNIFMSSVSPPADGITKGSLNIVLGGTIYGGGTSPQDESDNNTIIGANTESRGQNNTALGKDAKTYLGQFGTITNATAIGYQAHATATNTIQLGNSAITDVITSGTVSTTGGVETTTVTATSFVGDGSGLTNLPSSSLNASTTARLSEIFIQPHEVTTNTSVSYPPGYSINLIPFPEGTGTVMGGVLIPLMMPSNWNRGNVTVTFYYSCSAADGNIRFNTGARRYGTGDVNITYPVSPFYLTPSAAWTLNKHTYTQSVLDYSTGSGDDSILIINFSRYAYQPQNYGDTNTGDMYIHGIRIAYSTN